MVPHSREQRVSDDDDIDKLAREIYSHLPVMESPEEFPDPFLEVDINLADRDLEEAQKISTPSAWAKFALPVIGVLAVRQKPLHDCIVELVRLALVLLHHLQHYSKLRFVLTGVELSRPKRPPYTRSVSSRAIRWNELLVLQ